MQNTKTTYALLAALSMLALSGCSGGGGGGSAVAPPPQPTMTQCPDGSSVPVGTQCPVQMTQCPDGSSVPVGTQCPVQMTQCPDGSSVPVGTQCPVQMTQCPDGSSVPVGTQCPVQMTQCPDGSSVPVGTQCPVQMTQCPDGSSVPVGTQCPVQMTQCPDGSSVPVGTQCPVQMTQCPDGSSVPVGTRCPVQMTQCPDGSSVPVGTQCPVQMTQCPDGSSVPVGTQCPVQMTQCPDGSSVPVGTQCPPEPGGGTRGGYSNNEWVALTETSPWFGSEYQTRLRNTYSSASFGEVNASGCLEGWGYEDCDENTEVPADFVVLTQVPFNRTLIRDGMSMVWARGISPHDEEEHAAIVGYTDYGKWVVFWSEEAGNTYSTRPSWVPEEWNWAVDYGVNHNSEFERLQRLPDGNDTWSATYEGHMVGVAHSHGGSPVGGDATVTAEFAYDSWVNSVEIEITRIRGSTFGLPDIHFPLLFDPGCVGCKTPNGDVGITSFELEYGGQYVEGNFAGPRHDAVHGVFSTSAVSGAFGAVQTSARNRPPLDPN